MACLDVQAGAGTACPAAPNGLNGPHFRYGGAHRAIGCQSEAEPRFAEGTLTVVQTQRKVGRSPATVTRRWWHIATASPQFPPAAESSDNEDVS